VIGSTSDTVESMSVIEARGLVKRYGDVTAVDGVDLDVPEGTFFGILGPNGAGKTTLLEIIEGIRQPDAGEARIFGSPTWPRNRAVLPKIGVQLQASAFFERLSTREQLETIADLYGVPRSRVADMIELVGMTDKASTQAEKLSGGQQQRLAIACALIHDPAVVFLDEPTAALDPQARRNLWDVLRAINAEGRTVVLTTHYMDEAEILCEQVAIMDHGKILTVDAPAALVRNLRAATRVSLPLGVLTEEEARGIPGVTHVDLDDESLTMASHDPSATLSTLASQGLLGGLQVRGATLEDVFLTLTGREYRS
jgi:ABC-2 type transport system ATP-binding protein